MCHLSLLAKIAPMQQIRSVAFVVPTDGRQSTYSVAPPPAQKSWRTRQLRAQILAAVYKIKT